MASDYLFTGSVWKLVRRMDAWTPGRVYKRLRKLILIPVYAPQQARILRVLRHAAYAELLRTQPRLPFKYMEGEYLALGLGRKERSACLLHHYERLLACLPHEALSALPSREIVLLEMQEAGAVYRVTMGLPGLFQDEGELCLRLYAEGTEIYLLSFTIAPGRVVQSQAADALLVTRLQGASGEWKRIQSATRALHNVAPGALLMAALQGVAGAWEIGLMAGVCARRHRSYDESCAATMHQAYDAFFTEIGIVQNEQGFFVSELPLAQKPMWKVKQGHKLRTREKRAFKQEIADRVKQALTRRNEVRC